MLARTSALVLTLFFLLIAAPAVRALSIAQPTNLDEAMDASIALVEWDTMNGGDAGAYTLDTGVLGKGFFLPKEEGATGIWFWMHDTWLYAASPSNGYYYIPAIGWTYHLVGSAWFVDLATGQWFELNEGLPG